MPKIVSKRELVKLCHINGSVAVWVFFETLYGQCLFAKWQHPAVGCGMRFSIPSSTSYTCHYNKFNSNCCLVLFVFRLLTYKKGLS